MVDPSRKHSTAVVFETINVDEFNQLSQPERNWLSLCLGCEYVDLTDASKTLVKLFEMFPSGTTRTNLDNLLFENTE